MLNVKVYSVAPNTHNFDFFLCPAKYYSALPTQWDQPSHRGIQVPIRTKI